MVTNSQKKVIKRVIIKPSKMVLADNHDDLERIRKELAATLKIQTSDITFYFSEVDKGLK